MWQKMVIAGKESFLLNVTGLLDPSLKDIDKFRLRQYSIQCSFNILSVTEQKEKKKKVLEQCVKYINNKDTRTMDVMSTGCHDEY